MVQKNNSDSLKSTYPFRNLFVYLYFSFFQIQNVGNPLLTTSHAKMIQLNTVYNTKFLHFVPFFLMSQYLDTILLSLFVFKSLRTAFIIIIRTTLKILGTILQCQKELIHTEKIQNLLSF